VRRQLPVTRNKKPEASSKKNNNLIQNPFYIRKLGTRMATKESEHDATTFSSKYHRLHLGF
jgi:hypothetical protein